jgi:hypothetical protein
MYLHWLIKDMADILGKVLGRKLMPSNPLLDLDNPRWKLEHSAPSPSKPNVRALRTGTGA